MYIYIIAFSQCRIYIYVHRNVHIYHVYIKHTHIGIHICTYIPAKAVMEPCVHIYRATYI